MRIETRKRLFYVAVGAAALSVAIVRVSQTSGRHGTDKLLLGAYWVGTLASGNAHQPDEIVTWATLFVVVLIALDGLLSIASWALARRRCGT